MGKEKYLYQVVNNWTGNVEFESEDRKAALERLQELNTSNYYRGTMHITYDLEKIKMEA